MHSRMIGLRFAGQRIARVQIRRVSGEPDPFRALAAPVVQAAHDVARALERGSVPYAIAGAVAANAHGYRRATEDVDVLVNKEDLGRVSAVIDGRGWVARYPGSKRSFKQASSRVNIDFIVSGEFPGDGLPKPVAFPEIEPKPGGIRLTKVAGLSILPLVDLIELKLASGMSAPNRRKDLADVQELIKANDLPFEFVTELNYSVKQEFARLWEEVQAGKKAGVL